MGKLGNFLMDHINLRTIPNCNTTIHVKRAPIHNHWEFILFCDDDVIPTNYFGNIMTTVGQMLLDEFDKNLLGTAVNNHEDDPKCYVSKIFLNGGITDDDALRINILNAYYNLMPAYIRQTFTIPVRFGDLYNKAINDGYELPHGTVEQIDKLIIQIKRQKNVPANLQSRLEHISEGEISPRFTFENHYLELPVQYSVPIKKLSIKVDYQDNWKVKGEYFVLPDIYNEIHFTILDEELFKSIGLIDRDKFVQTLLHALIKRFKSSDISFEVPLRDEITKKIKIDGIKDIPWT